MVLNAWPTQKLRDNHLPTLPWSAVNIIYVIFHANPQSRQAPSLLYVGKTQFPLAKRFEQHAGLGKKWVPLSGAARKLQESYGLHRHIHQYGIQDLVMVPLEQILVPPTDHTWEKASCKLERKWIFFMKSLMPAGHNSMTPGTKQVSFSQILDDGRPGPHLFDPVEQMYHEDATRNNSYIYASRRFTRRLLHLRDLLSLHGQDFVTSHPQGGYRTRNVSRMWRLACLHRLPQLSVEVQLESLVGL